MVGHWNRDRNHIAYKMVRYPRYNVAISLLRGHCYLNFFHAMEFATFSFSKISKKEEKKKKKKENFSSLLNIFHISRFWVSLNSKRKNNRMNFCWLNSSDKSR